MKTPLRLLHLEDDPNDAALVQAALVAGGIACSTLRVDNRDDFLAALERGGIDLILSDISLPAFDGISAMEIARTRCPSVPVILVSGTRGEEPAIDSLKRGATDYVLKEHLARLVPAVRRAMGEIDSRAEKVRLEAQLIEAQKMEVLGQLAGGVAHDFNNILAVIMGYSDLMTTALGPDSPLLKYSEEVRLASVRAAGLTRQLLVFSRKQMVLPTTLDLNDVVKDLEEMLRRLIDENVDLMFAAGRDLGRIKADAGYVGQVLMNLVVNSRDAMPNGGELRIKTTNVTLNEQQAREHDGVVSGDYVMLSVSDTGIGMSPAVKLRMFDPFFTTKGPGKGTGLGLATCRTIVQQSGGHIEVSSEVGEGATFRIYFPRVEGTAERVVPAIPIGPTPRGTETLMVVEDEPAVRHLARSVLSAQGYHVLSATNGQDALNVAKTHHGSPIRLVITDVVMPLMGGKMMAEWLKTTYPDLRILFTSGYTDEAITRQGVLDAGVDFLPKPYTPSTLVRKVRELIDAPRTSGSDEKQLARSR